MITDAKMAELVVRANNVMQKGWGRAAWVPEREAIASPVLAVILAELIRDERESPNKTMSIAGAARFTDEHPFNNE